MRVKLTGIIEVQVEVETDVEDGYFHEWYLSASKKYGGPWADYPFHVLHCDDKSMYLERYFQVHTDDASEAWAAAPRIEDGEVLTAEFVSAEVI